MRYHQAKSVITSVSFVGGEDKWGTEEVERKPLNRSTGAKGVERKKLKDPIRSRKQKYTSPYTTRYRRNTEERYTYSTDAPETLTRPTAFRN